MLVRVRDALDSGLRRLGIMRKARRAQAADVWPEVVGPIAADVSAPTSCKEGILFVAVKNSVWANELSFLKTDIIRKLNRRLGRGTIVDVRFQARWPRGQGGSGGARPSRSARGSQHVGSQAAPPDASRRRPLTGAEEQRVQELCGAIPHPEVRLAFAEALAAAFRGGGDLRERDGSYGEERGRETPEDGAPRDRACR